MIIPCFSKMVSTNGNGFPLKGNGFPLQGVSTNGKQVYLRKGIACILNILLNYFDHFFTFHDFLDY